MEQPRPDVASFVAVVPLRGGSKGMPGKNTAMLAGRMLYLHAVEQAIAAGANRIVVTTDIPTVLQAKHPDSVTLRRRPPELALDATPMAPVLTDAITHADLDDREIVVLLQPTSPLRRPEQIRAAVRQYCETGQDLIMSVCAVDPGVLKYGTLEGQRFIPLRDSRHPFTNRQDLPPVYRPNGAIYVFGAGWFRRNASLATESIGAYVMDVKDSVDIDSAADLERCAARLATLERTAS